MASQAWCPAEPESPLFHELRDKAAARKRGADSAVENLQDQRDKSPDFVGRDLELLARLAGIHGQVAVHGSGGTGKTEYALQYARAYLQSGQRRVAGGGWRVAWWLAERAVNWLRSNRQWLIVFDNVNSLEGITGILSELRGCGSADPPICPPIGQVLDYAIRYAPTPLTA